MTIFRVGVIGVGAIGRHHARIFDELEDVQLVGIADPDAARARPLAERYGCRLFGNHHALLEAAGLDAVTIAVPTSLHQEVATDILEQGVPALIEKPLAQDPDRAKSIVQLAVQNDVPIGVGHLERFNPAIIALKELIEAGGLGDVLSVVARRVGPVPPQRTNTNVIVDLAVHDIDIFGFLLGSDPELLAVSSGHAQQHEHEDWADLMLRCAGASCFLQVNWVTPIKVRRLSVTGTQGYAELNYVTQTLDLFESIPWHEVQDFDQFIKDYGEAPKQRIPVEKNEPLKLELAAFVASVREGTTFPVSGADGLRAVELADEAVRRAQADAQRV